MSGMDSTGELLERATNRIRSLESRLLLILDHVDGVSDGGLVAMRVSTMCRESLGNPNAKKLAELRDGRPTGEQSP